MSVGHTTLGGGVVVRSIYNKTPTGDGELRLEPILHRRGTTPGLLPIVDMGPDTVVLLRAVER